MAAGKGGSTAGAGEGGVPGNECNEGDGRCTAGAHESCLSGAWAPDPCPLNEPTCDVDSGSCIVRGPTLVKVGGFYIDSTEVTVVQYEEFTTAKAGDTTGQSAVCSWNDDYEPADLQGLDTWPVTDVDWCDAAAYCQWADMHLCGAIDRSPLPVGSVFDKSVSQWFLACGGGGYHPNSNWDCNETGGFGMVAPVASFPGCEGYVSGLFDMEGNVAEWVDVCDGATGASDVCYLLGGSVQDAKGNSFCAEKYDGFTRDETSYNFGFRCCSG